MSPYYDDHGATVYQGDCLTVMATMEPDRVDTVITDPPYHLTSGKSGGSGAASLNPNSPAGRSRIGTGFMGKSWDGGDVAFRPETWAAVLRVCKPGAMLLAFGGTRTFHRLTCAIEDAGWEIRDCMSWLYGSGFPKSLDISKAIDKAAGAEKVVGTKPDRWTGKGNSLNFSTDRAQSTCKVTAPATAEAQLWNGWGTALKPAWEPIIVAMKPLAGTFAENALTHGVAGLNIDGGRIHTAGSEAKGYTVKRLKPGATLNKTGGNWRPADGVEYEGTTKDGRWPANVILDEVAAGMLDEQSGHLQSGTAHVLRRGGTTGKGMGFGSSAAGNVDGAALYGDAGGASRFYYTAKASRSDRGHGNDHPTVKPTDLIKYLCKLTATPTGGLILDPFCGSGTTLVAAREMGRPAIGIELEESHCRIIANRLAQGVLFGAAASPREGSNRD